LDGTIVKHNGYKLDGYDTLLAGAKNFLNNIPYEDMILIITSRSPVLKDITEHFLTKSGIRYDHIIYNAPFGERILINDKKSTGLKTAVAVNLERDSKVELSIEIDMLL
jgi:hypothetical protein